MDEERSSNNGENDEEDDTGDSGSRGGRFLIQNVGGSATFLLQVALLAWGVRQLRAVLAKRREKQQRAVSLGGSTAPAFAFLSVAALKVLLDFSPTPYILLDVRRRESIKSAPPPFDGTINIPEWEVRSALQLPKAAWEHRFEGIPQLGKRQLIVFLSSTGQKAQQAAAAAASLGYGRGCVLMGGLQAYSAGGGGQSAAAAPKLLSRDALALLLEVRGSSSDGAKAARARSDSGSGNGSGDGGGRYGEGEPGDEETKEGLKLEAEVVLLDLRRHDERTLYGAIPGSRHLPVDRLPLALAMDAGAWEQHFHFPKVQPTSILVLYCRTNKRAKWGAQLAADAGLPRCYVYKDGVWGWRLHPSVMVYESYEEGEAPPAPVPFETQVIERAKAKRELLDLKIL